jgi:TonB-dependent receptor
VTPEESRRRIEAEFSDPFEAEGSYRHIFPGLHFKYEPTRIKGLVVRGSWATNIGRAAINTLVPTLNVSYDTQRVTVNNPGLKPQYADNFDLGMEYYFEPVGMFSAGVFLKEISDFIFTDTSQRVGAGPDNGYEGYYEGFEIQTQANGGHARIRGWEVAYQQQFTFLPGWMKGFGAYANYTWLQTHGDYGTIGNVSVTNEVAGFRPTTANAGISYNRNGHSIAIQANYIGRFLSSYSADVSLLQWTDADPQIDIKSVYRINPKLDAYLDVWNLFSMRPWGELWGGRPRSASKMLYMVHAGLRARF